ncbi:MAG: hypothetical protein FLDDKLPJ_00602 [Phycisphaerae bacterium]|nr:hypothetical protein [Phycisphaerae bacterium]
MSEHFNFGERLGPLVEKVVQSYWVDGRTRHIDRQYLPSRARIIELTELLLELVFPGFFGRQNLTTHNVAFHVGDLLPRVGELTYTQILNCLCYEAEARLEGRVDEPACEGRARALTLQFVERMPAVREMLGGDVQAAFDGDPAALNLDEVVLAYPGLFATAVYRLAHELYRLHVPMMPRIMSEWAHMMTGVDIHPGARIGRGFFIDHGTGVVIGETTDIGNNVKIYQGVTLGALSIPKDERGRAIRGRKRHPTVQDNVTIYANAIVLGGDTVVGEGAIVGGSVFVTTSVPPMSTVTFKPPELHFKTKSAGAPAPTSDRPGQIMPDYEI